MKAVFVHGQRGSAVLQGNDVKKALGFSCSPVGFCAAFFAFFLGTACAKVFVPVPDLFVRQVRCRFPQHFVDGFVEVVDIFRKGGAAPQRGHRKREGSEIMGQVFAAFSTGEDVAQGEDKVPVFLFLSGGGRNGVIKRHGMEKVPEGRAPDVGQHAIARGKLGFGVDGFSSGFVHHGPV